mmetsp:Transcript_409/g.1557  ORF Transcript_409/g.1557 Transcript_409/m.1557 type:complete len:83 (-) Transcript_409:2629-2877(-)
MRHSSPSLHVHNPTTTLIVAESGVIIHLLLTINTRGVNQRSVSNFPIHLLRIDNSDFSLPTPLIGKIRAIHPIKLSKLATLQ